MDQSGLIILTFAPQFTDCMLGVEAIVYELPKVNFVVINSHP